MGIPHDAKLRAGLQPDQGDVLDFSGTRSVVAVDGTIAFAHTAPKDGIVLVDWTAATRALTNWRTVSLDG